MDDFSALDAITREEMQAVFLDFQSSAGVTNSPGDTSGRKKRRSWDSGLPSYRRVQLPF